MDRTKQSFVLDWYGTKYPHEGLEASVFADAIGGFKDAVDDYIILTPDPPIQNSIYLQTHSPEKGETVLPLEYGLSTRMEALSTMRWIRKTGSWFCAPSLIIGARASCRT